MKVTFLVGNGFDKGAGLLTGYSDFYKWYFSKETSSETIKVFKKEIKESLIRSIINNRNNKTSEPSLWSDLEYGLGQCTEDLFKNRPTDYLLCYEDIHDSMNQYIMQENKAVDLEHIPENEMARFKTGLEKFYEDLSPAERQTIKKMFDGRKEENCELRFISFNYTNTLETCLRGISKPALRTWVSRNTQYSMFLNPSVIYVHGMTDYYPIVGVNDETQIANKEFLKNPDITDSIIKPTSVNAIGELWHRDAEAIISESDIVCIFGMSLGCTDGKWWSHIMKWLSSGTHRQLIVFWHNDEIKDTVSILKKRQQEREIKEKLLKYIKEPDKSSTSLSSRIHVVINTKRVLQIKLRRKLTNNDAFNDAVGDFLDRSTSLSSVL